MINDVIYSQKAFYGSGYFMLRMPLIHQWILLIVIYSIALGKSLKNIKFLRRTKLKFKKSRICMYFVLSVLGMGLFSYYQGRSHNDVFVLVTWPALIILALFADEYIQKIKIYLKDNKKSFTYMKVDLLTYMLKSIFILVILMCFSLSFIYNAVNNDKIKTLENKKIIQSNKI